MNKSPLNVAFRRTRKSSDEWYTPPEIITALGKFDLDPACGSGCVFETATRKIGPELDGLKQDWEGQARYFAEKMRQHGNGVMLVFTRSDARWWQQSVAAAGAVFLFKGRIQFYRPGQRALACPLGCCLIPFGHENREAVRRAKFEGIYCDVSSMK